MRVRLLAVVTALLLAAGGIVAVIKDDGAPSVSDGDRAPRPAIVTERIVVMEVGAWNVPERVWTMAPDGSQRRRVVLGTPEAEAIGPIVFDAIPADERGCVLPPCIRRIWVARSDGSRARPVTSGPYADSAPVVSPDGRRVVFLRARLGTDAAAYLVVASMDGMILRTLGDRDNGFFGQPAWSPDGREVVAMDWAQHRVAVFDVATGRERILVDGQYHGFSWAPDGRSVAVIGQEVRGDHVEGSDVFLIPRAGGRLRNLTRMEAVRSRQPKVCDRSVDRSGGFADVVWSPDGRSIALLSTYRHVPRGLLALDVARFDLATRQLDVIYPARPPACESDESGTHIMGEGLRRRLLGWIRVEPLPEGRPGGSSVDASVTAGFQPAFGVDRG